MLRPLEITVRRESTRFCNCISMLALHFFDFLLADFWQKLIKIQPRSLAERGDRIGAGAFPIVAIQEEVMLRKSLLFGTWCVLVAYLPCLAAGQSAADRSIQQRQDNPPAIDHLLRLGLIDESRNQIGAGLSLDEMENARQSSENNLQRLPRIRTDEGCGPDDFRKSRSNADVMIPMMNMNVGTVVPAGYVVEVSTACESDQLLAECLAAAELTPEKRAQLILKTLDSIRRQTRDEAFAEVLQSRAENQQDHAVNSFTTPSPDAYFKPDQTDDTQDLREIVLRLERQQQLMQYQAQQMSQLQYQVQQMQDWHPSFGRSLRELESSVSRAQVQNAIHSANTFQLPEYSRPVAQTPQPLEPIYNPYGRNDDNSGRQVVGSNDELRQLELVVEQINQRIRQLTREQDVSEARYLGVPPLSTRPTPLLPR